MWIEAGIAAREVFLISNLPFIGKWIYDNSDVVYLILISARNPRAMKQQPNGSKKIVGQNVSRVYLIPVSTWKKISILTSIDIRTLR